MSGVRFIEDRGKRILYIDAGNCEMEELIDVIEKTKVLIVNEPPGSVLTLTVLGRTIYHSIYRKIAKEFTSFNKPYVKAGAIVGLAPAQVKEFEEVMNYAHREFKFFDDIPHALEWLIQQ